MNQDSSSKNLTLHMIGNAHLDPVWLWQWPEGIEAARATFRSALDIMEEIPDFIFTCSSAAVYQWIEKVDFELFERIKKAVAAGKWCIVGGWWLEPDCNLPAGESLARQGLYGQRYFLEKFGRMAQVGYNIDSFGHSGMLPQILKQSGINYYVFMRPMAEEKSLPPLFWWESSDGSRILAYRIPISYLTEGDQVEDDLRKFLAQVKPCHAEMMFFYGVGNHGGGPTKKAIAEIIRLNKNSEMPRLIFSDPDTFFRQVCAKNFEVPVVHDALQNTCCGCYSAVSQIKRNNRRAENILLTAEKFAVIAYRLLGRPYPRMDLTTAWKDLLFNQFHDILAGTCIPEAYEDARDLHGRAIQNGMEHLIFSTQAIAAKINTQGSGPALIVFNPHSWEVKAPIEFRPYLHNLRDSDGNSILLQKVENHNIITQKERSTAVVKVPPLGYRVYWDDPNITAEDEDEYGGVLEATRFSLENAWLKLEVEPVTGAISCLYDKRHNIEVFSGRAGVPIVINDLSDTWGHNVNEFRDECGRFMDARVNLVESGPVRARLRVESKYNQSTLRQDFIVYRELPYIECRVEVNWQETYKMLKLSFPVNLEEPLATLEIPFGYMERPNNGQEEPGQNWADVTGWIQTAKGERLNYGVSIINDSKYSHDIKGSEIRLTVLRSPSYADHQTKGSIPEISYRSIDNGFQTFKYLILPHQGDWRRAGTVRLGWELNQPLLWLVESNHHGILRETVSFIKIEPNNIILSSLKLHEDSNNLIIRLYESEGRNTKAFIRLDYLDRQWSSDFRSGEIKTFKIPNDNHLPVEETNFLEMD